MSIVDISDPGSPKIIANLRLENSIIGPPTNLAITPDGQLAIVANSIHQVPDGAGWKGVPDNKLYVIDLTTRPPATSPPSRWVSSPPASTSTGPATWRW